jgi:hypothetical protein
MTIDITMPKKKDGAIMLSFIVMIGFSVYLMAYGFIALFKKDLLWKIRGFSAKIEGKAGEKRDEETTANLNRMGNIMGTLALILGIVGFIVSLAAIVIYMQAQAGPIDL